MAVSFYAQLLVTPRLEVELLSSVGCAPDAAAELVAFITPTPASRTFRGMFLAVFAPQSTRSWD